MHVRNIGSPACRAAALANRRRWQTQFAWLRHDYLPSVYSYGPLPVFHDLDFSLLHSVHSKTRLSWSGLSGSIRVKNMIAPHHSHVGRGIARMIGLW
jgi:hypothetical protein